MCLTSFNPKIYTIWLYVLEPSYERLLQDQWLLVVCHLLLSSLSFKGDTPLFLLGLIGSIITKANKNTFCIYFTKKIKNKSYILWVQEMQNIETHFFFVWTRTSFVMLMVSHWNDVSMLFICLHSCTDNKLNLEMAKKSALRYICIKWWV